jgi:hypothetical protein
MKYIDKNHIPTDKRPLGYWLRAIEGPLRESMRGAFSSFGVSRREWRTLTTLHAAPADLDGIRAALPSRRRPEHGPGRGHDMHRTLEQLLESFVNRGWATLDAGVYTLTDEGTRIHDAVLANVQKVRAQVTDGIADDDYVTTMATLEKIAGNVGFDPEDHESHRGHRGHRYGRGFGHRHGDRHHHRSDV